MTPAKIADSEPSTVRARPHLTLSDLTLAYTMPAFQLRSWRTASGETLTQWRGRWGFRGFWYESLSQIRL